MHMQTDQPPIHPGEALREDFLPELGLTQQQLAERLHISFRRVNEILNEKRPVTMDTALRLGRLFGQSPAFWMNMQLAYDLWHAEHGGAAGDIEDIRPLDVAYG
jgi:addiction module HigA family antidote